MCARGVSYSGMATLRSRAPSSLPGRMVRDGGRGVRFGERLAFLPCNGRVRGPPQETDHLAEGVVPQPADEARLQAADLALRNRGVLITGAQQVIELVGKAEDLQPQDLETGLFEVGGCPSQCVRGHIDPESS